MNKKSTSQKLMKIKKAENVKRVVDYTQSIVGEVDTVNKIISNTLYVRDNVAVDLQNFSLISISDFKSLN